MATVSHTLYVNHICDKINMNELKRHLFSIFSTYGTILEIRSHKGLKRRGQAWITFEKVEDAIEAKNMLNNYYLFDRPICVQFSKARSQVTQKVSGTWNPYGRRAECIDEIEAKQLTKGAIPKYYDFDMQSGEQQDVDLMGQINDELLAKANEKKASVTVPTVNFIPPNKVLFVQNLFSSADDSLMTLNMLFGQYRGFKEARTVPTNPEIAFVEFEKTDQATIALDELNGTELAEDKRMLIQYANQLVFFVCLFIFLIT